ncbi:MAG: glycosyltransferase family 2 protein [Tannerella sp.]|jgi:GT2 family glycosyltransferase|nr:glycosyltransferase family 2 protein [Tannerella sp.]
MPDMLSVVIITWNAGADLETCLDSVLEATTCRSAEIIVVDNGSTDGTGEILQSYDTRVKIIRLDRNYGVAYARNTGMKTAKGDYIWILDVDTVVNRDAVDGMLDYLENHPECGLCSCRLQSEGGDVQDSCRRLPYPVHKIRNLLSGETVRPVFPEKIRRHIEKQNEKQFYRKEISGREPFEADYVIGACQLFRKTVLDEVGYLDEKIFYGPEDADFCFRICRKGYKIICLPACHIVHRYNRISGKKIFSRMSLLHLKGLLYFYAKHHLLTSNPYNQSNHG